MTQSHACKKHPCPLIFRALLKSTSRCTGHSVSASCYRPSVCGCTTYTKRATALLYISQMQLRALPQSRVCRVCHKRPSLVCHLVPQPASHTSLANSTLGVSPVHSEVLPSTSRRKIHLSAVVYAPNAVGNTMAASEIAFATGNENKLREVGHRGWNLLQS